MTWTPRDMKREFFETVRKARRTDEIYFEAEFDRYDCRGYSVSYGCSPKCLCFGFDKEPYVLTVDDDIEVDYERRVECAKLAIEWAKDELSEWQIDCDTPEIRCNILCRIYQRDTDSWEGSEFFLTKTEDGVEEGWCF